MGKERGNMGRSKEALVPIQARDDGNSDLGVAVQSGSSGQILDWF